MIASLLLRAGVVALAMALTPATVFGALDPSVSADMFTPDPKIRKEFRKGSTTSFYLWTNLSGPEVVVGPQYNMATSFRDGNMVTSPIKPASQKGIQTIKVGEKKYPDVKGQTIVAQRNVAKPPAFVSQIATDSSSAIGKGQKLFDVSAEGDAFTFPDKIVAKVAATKGAQGSGASLVADPADLAPGDYPLHYVDGSGMTQDAYLLDGQIGPVDLGVTEALEFMVFDDRFGSSDSTAVGDPADNLWTLTISADKPIVSRNDLAISFMVNPEAARFFPSADACTVTGTGLADILTDSSGNPLNRCAIENTIRGAITVSDGVATLNPVDPFPFGSVYHVDQDIVYGVGDAAALTAVPEPSIAWLLALTLVVFVVRACRRKTLLTTVRFVRGAFPRLSA